MLTNLIVGVVGAFTANMMGMAFGGFIGSFLVSTVGAVLLLAIVGMFKARRAS